MIKWLKSILGLNNYKIQTFTYYIPAPPSRDSGYREKQFDKVFYEFINKGFDIIDIKTQSHSSQNAQGMWVLVTVRATNKESSKLDLEFDREISNSTIDENVEHELKPFKQTNNNNEKTIELGSTTEGDKVEGLFYTKD